jgi:acetylornithine deacetylase
VCAQAGALTFEGTVHGVAAHAAHRLEGVSAIDRYLPVHEALAAHERALNAGVEHPLMRALELPYPLVVGRLHAGEWSSSVPDRLVFEGRAPVKVGETPAQARAAVEGAVAAAGDGAVELRWTGGQFASGETPSGHPFATLVRDAFSAEAGRRVRFVGVPWGADMRLWCARGIPCVMAGPPGIERAHAVDERVGADDLLTVARAILRVIWGFSSRPA